VSKAKSVCVILSCGCFHILFGVLADRVGRKRVLTFGALFGVVFPVPMFAMFETGSPWLVGLALTLGICVQGSTSSPAGALLSELFPTDIRWSGIAISREIPAAVVGGTIPLVATALVAVGECGM
jgi:MFS transporter, MHS family, shikimate and dehydroshikimate transport protein